MAVSISGEGVISGSSSYSFDSNVSIAGTTTIEDVTSVDSIGIVTAQRGVRIPAGGLTVSGVSTTADIHVTSGELVVSGISSHGGFNVTGVATINYINVIGDPDLSNSCVFGRHSLTDRTTGISNAIFGRAAGMGITSGSENTALGNYALKSNLAGDSNVAVGYYALVLTTGSNNVGVGRDALRYNTSGSNNTAIGHYAGFFIGGSNNTILGAYQGIAEDSTLSDTVIISAGTSERLRVDSSGRIGIGLTNPTRKLEVVGRISKTLYEPGEMIECIETIANGINVTVGSGTYSPTSVSGVQDLSSSYADINGSVFTYNVPVGTKRLIYDFWVYMRDKDVGPLLHFKGLTTPDGSSTYTTVNDSRHTWRGSTASADYQTWIHNRMVLFENSIDEEDIGAGKLYLLGGTTRKLKFQCREYSASYEGQLHTSNNWDGSGTDILVRPHIRISAYA